LKRLLDELSTGGHDIFLHLDAKSPLLSESFADSRVFPFADRIPITWAGFSFVQAVCRLLRAAGARGGYGRFVLLSGADYPVRGQERINAFFAANMDANFINTVRMPGLGKSLERMSHYYFESARSPNRLVSGLMSPLERWMKRLVVGRRLAAPYDRYELYGGSTWWCLSGEFVRYLLNFIDANPAFTRFYRYTLCPDEMFFQTIIMNSPFRGTVRPACTFTEWRPHASHPEMIGLRHLPVLAQSSIDSVYGRFEPLFARKFDDGSEECVRMIRTTASWAG